MFDIVTIQAHTIQAHTRLILTSMPCFSSEYALHLGCPCSVLPVGSKALFKDDLHHSELQFSHLQYVGA